MSRHQSVERGNFEIYAYEADGAIAFNQVVQLKSGDSNKVVNGVANSDILMVAGEPASHDTDAYVAGDAVQVIIPQRGAIVKVRVTRAAAIAVNSGLKFAAGGNLGVAAAADKADAIALEAVSAQANATAIIRVLVS